MAAYSGRPTLAALSSAAVPTIPAVKERALARFRALAATFEIATHPHDRAARLAFDAEVIAARQHKSYEYSAAFLAGVEEAMAELEHIATPLNAPEARRVA